MRDARRIRTPRAFENVRELQTATTPNLAQIPLHLPGKLTHPARWLRGAGTDGGIALARATMEARLHGGRIGVFGLAPIPTWEATGSGLPDLALAL